MRTFPTMLLLVLLPTLASAGIYKWVDGNGRIGFSDKPQNANADYYVPKTRISSFERARNSNATEKRATNQPGVKSSVNRKSAKGLESVEMLQEKPSARETQRKARIRSSPKPIKAFPETQAQHDRRTNYDGYGSDLSRYQNAIIMKPHNSILKGGNMEYWNGLDDYRYRVQHQGKVRRPRW